MSDLLLIVPNNRRALLETEKKFGPYLETRVQDRTIKLLRRLNLGDRGQLTIPEPGIQDETRDTIIRDLLRGFRAEKGSLVYDLQGVDLEALSGDAIWQAHLNRYEVSKALYPSPRQKPQESPHPPVSSDAPGQRLLFYP